MALFISEQPFSIETDKSDPKIQLSEIRLSLAVSEPYASIPPSAHQAIEFVLDTGADYAAVFPDNLVDSGIDINSGPSGGMVYLILQDGSRSGPVPMRDVTLWLFSNIPGTQPYRIDPNGGVVVFPKPTSSYTNPFKPMIGMNPLLDAKVRIILDFENRLFSVWIPE